MTQATIGRTVVELLKTISVCLQVGDNQKVAEEIGADGYSYDAAVAVELVKSLKEAV